MLRAAIGAAIGGLVGALIWALLGRYANVEIGWVAWGVGGLAGLGASRAVAREELSPATGIVAAVIALLAVAAGKFAAVHLAIADAIPEEIVVSDELAISCLADDVIEERLNAGEDVSWPGGEMPESPQAEEDYAPEIWSVARERWGALGPEGREQKREELHDLFEQNVSDFASTLRAEGFKQSFGPLDLLFGFLAVGTAFRLGSGAQSQRGQRPPAAGSEPGAGDPHEPGR